MTTFVKSQKAHGPEDSERWEEKPVANTISPRDGTAPTVISIQDVRGVRDKKQNGIGIGADGDPMFTLDKTSQHAVAVLGLSENQRAEVRLTETARQLTSGGGKPGQGYPAVLISSSADSLAKICPSPANAPDSKAPDPPSSSNSSELQTNLFDPEATFWSRTSRVYSVLMPDGTSQPSSGYWPTSGFMISPGEFSIPNSSEWPNVGGACSSLRDVLEADVAPKYFLSQRAAAGILRRAAKRGKALPGHLEAALRAAAQSPTPTE